MSFFSSTKKTKTYLLLSTLLAFVFLLCFLEGILDEKIMPEREREGTIA
jgi:hypothetical protein